MATRGQLQSRKAERGSITVYAVFLLPIMLMMCLLLANVGQAIFEKVRLQNTVDAAALAAATVQSAGLNEIADLNFEIDLEYYKMLLYLVSAPFWDSYSDGKACVDYFDEVFEKLRDYQDEANEDYAEKAQSIAQRVVEDNLPKATLTSVRENDDQLCEFEDPEERNWYFIFRICSCCSCGVGCACSCCPSLPVCTWDDNRAGSKKYRLPHDGRQWQVNTGIPIPMFGTVSTKREKKETPTTYAAFKITQPATDFILASGVFGQLEELTAYAAAKPAGGTVYDGKPEYKPIMVLLRSLDPRPDIDDLNQFEH